MNTPKSFDWSFRPFLMLGYATLALLVLGLGGWGVMARISGAVIAMGTVEVQGNRQVVQHPIGGVITEILARDGDVVEEGAVLLRLEGDAKRTEHATVEGQLFELVARQNRLEALRDGQNTITFDDEILARRDELPQLAELMAAQEQQFAGRRETLQKEQSQLTERSLQIEKQIEGLEFQLAAIKEQVDLTGQELSAQETLMAQGLTQLTRVLSARSDLAELKGNQGAAEASIAENRAKIAEIDLEKIKIENQQRDEAIAELREIEFQVIELRARRQTLGDDIARLDVRAPVGGIVYGSTADTLTGVVRAAEPILYIVPQEVDLIARARVDAAKIDQVHAGQRRQPALLRLRFPHHAGRPGQGHQGLGRHLHRRAHRAVLLPGGHRPRRNRARRARGPQARARHAGRGLHRHRHAHPARLPREADGRLLQPRLPRTLTRATRRR